MKLLTYEVDRRKDIGVMSRDEMWVYPLRAFGMEYTSMMEVVKGFSQSEKDLLEHVSDWSRTVSQGRPCVPR